MKNKYAICVSLYDNYKISETNLYYYKGILELISIKDRDFDIYVDTTQYCHDILLEILKQEDYKIDNIYFNIHLDSNLSSGALWRIKTMINISNNYECVGIMDSDSLSMTHNLTDIFCNNNYAIYGRQYIYDNIYTTCWSLIQHFQGCYIFISRKNFLTDFKKIQEIANKICNSNIIMPYEFDEHFMTSLFINELIHNNYAIITEDIQHYNNYIDKRKCTKYSYIKYNELKFYRDNKYYLNNLPKQMDYIKPEITKNDTKKTLYLDSKNKNLFLNIERYILGFLNTIDINCYE